MLIVREWSGDGAETMPQHSVPGHSAREKIFIPLQPASGMSTGEVCSSSRALHTPSLSHPSLNLSLALFLSLSINHSLSLSITLSPSLYLSLCELCTSHEGKQDKHENAGATGATAKATNTR